MDDRARLKPQSAALTIAAIAAATLGGAWYFELVLGLAPCPLCLDQRVPYYVAIPLALLLAALARDPGRARHLRTGFYLLAFLFVIAAGLGIYHAGIEWKLWAGPATCAGATLTPPGDILSSLRAPTRFVPCDEAAWRLLGISLAGYNALIAGALALFALSVARNWSFRGAAKRRTRNP